MSVAIITAGGIGIRTGNKVPKQFLTINDIPLIVYTMKNIENSKCYDEMYVVCSDGWRDFIYSYALQYNISIFKGTVSGGETRFDSYFNGIKAIYNNHGPSEVVSILDGNRPMTPRSVFQQSIDGLQKADCVLPLERCYDSMYKANNENYVVESSVKREVLFKGQSPETCRLGLAYKVCQEEKDMDSYSDKTLTMIMLQNNKNVIFVEGSQLNFKITTNEDLLLFKALCSRINI